VVKNLMKKSLFHRISEEAFLDNMPHWYPLCGHEDVKGLDIPQPTVLPPKHSRANSVSPRSVAGDKQSVRKSFITNFFK
jgi:predicted ATP-grasp superfamily ATP-dependent carboligase